MPSFKLKEIDEKTSDKIKVDIQDDRCNRYACRILKNVKIRREYIFENDKFRHFFLPFFSFEELEEIFQYPPLLGPKRWINFLFFDLFFYRSASNDYLFGHLLYSYFRIISHQC